jgi:hypothetical protein
MMTNFAPDEAVQASAGARGPSAGDDSGMQGPNLEPRSYARLRGRIPMNGAPAPRFGAPTDGYMLLVAASNHTVNLAELVPVDSPVAAIHNCAILKRLVGAGRNSRGCRRRRCQQRSLMLFHDSICSSFVCAGQGSDPAASTENGRRGETPWRCNPLRRPSICRR